MSYKYQREKPQVSGTFMPRFFMTVSPNPSLTTLLKPKRQLYRLSKSQNSRRVSINKIEERLQQTKRMSIPKEGLLEKWEQTSLTSGSESRLNILKSINQQFQDPLNRIRNLQISTLCLQQRRQQNRSQTANKGRYRETYNIFHSGIRNKSQNSPQQPVEQDQKTIERQLSDEKQRPQTQQLRHKYRRHLTYQGKRTVINTEHKVTDTNSLEQQSDDVFFEFGRRSRQSSSSNFNSIEHDPKYHDNWKECMLKGVTHIRVVNIPRYRPVKAAATIDVITNQLILS